jgi:hypothetical protein
LSAQVGSQLEYLIWTYMIFCNFVASGQWQGGPFLPLHLLLMSEEQAPTAASFSLETLTHALELLGDMPQLRLDSPVFLV